MTHYFIPKDKLDNEIMQAEVMGNFGIAYGLKLAKQMSVELKFESNKKASEFAKKCDPDNLELQKQADLYFGFKSGCEDVINQLYKVKMEEFGRWIFMTDTTCMYI